MPNTPLVIAENLKKHYPIRRPRLFSRGMDILRAVDGIDFEIFRGETFGLVGESGCGKSTLGRQILRLEDPTEGRVYFEGNDLMALDPRRLREMRCKAQIVFQDPYSSLNPRKTVARIIEDPLIIHKYGSRSERRQKVLSLIEEVGLQPEHAARYPHEFSGGQRQRICVARALALNPAFVLCDEPVSALDVSIQAQVVNLFRDLQERHHLTYLFISHDLNVVRYISNRVAVMYLGRFVELASSEAIYRAPLHPYTTALLSATPVADPKGNRDRVLLQGDVPSPIHPPPGCRFQPRCAKAREMCREGKPLWREIEKGHWVRCFLARQ
jgi:oligopeptide transport system ATP-binding protein